MVLAVLNVTTEARLAGLRRSYMLWSVLAFVAVAAAAFFGIGPVRETVALYGFADRANPYFIPERALLLYVLTPLASLATALFLLAPGLMLAATFGHLKTAAFWILSAFGWSVLTITAAVTLLQSLTGHVPKGETFWLVVAVVGLVSLLLLLWRLSLGHPLRVRLAEDRVDLFVAMAIYLACLILLSPKFYWENFTGDGHGSLKFARVFIEMLWPFWMPEAGTIAKAPGLSMVLFVIPESWLVRLWGETEFSVRAPYLMHLAMVYPVLLGLIRWGRQQTIAGIDHLLIVGALAVYTLSIIYSGGYNPYFGDSPMPAARETLSIAMFLGFALAYAHNRIHMMIVVGLMGAVTIPTGGLWLGMVAVAGTLIWRPHDWRRTRAAFAVTAFALCVSIFVPMLIQALGLNYPADGEFGPRAIVNRLRYVALLDWQRFLFVMVPCGIVPVFALLTWRRQDSLARLLTLATALFFLFFYLQGYRVLLHHFAPIMLVPVAVFWRSDLLADPRIRTVMRPVVAAGIAASLWLAWPAEMKMHTFDRQIGQHLETSGPRFESADRAPGDRFRGFNPVAIDTAHELLERLFPIGFDSQSAEERFYGAPLVWWYYSEFPKPDGQVINYRIKPLADARPEDGTLVAEHQIYGLFVRDLALYEQHRTTRLPTNTGAAIFVVSRDDMFGGGAQYGSRVVIDLVAVARSLLGQ